MCVPERLIIKLKLKQYKQSILYILYAWENLRLWCYKGGWLLAPSSKTEFLWAFFNPLPYMWANKIGGFVKKKKKYTYDIFAGVCKQRAKYFQTNFRDIFSVQCCHTRGQKISLGDLETSFESSQMSCMELLVAGVDSQTCSLSDLRSSKTWVIQCQLFFSVICLLVGRSWPICSTQRYAQATNYTPMVRSWL